MSRHVARNLDEARELIHQQKPFRLRGPGKPSLWATTEPPTDLGLLPPVHSAGIEDAVYVVMSYRTPIAWVDDDGEIDIPNVGYSPTTGQHQHLVAHAWGVDFYPARGRDVVAPPRNDSLWGQARRLRRGGVDGGRPEWLEEALVHQANALEWMGSPDPGPSSDAMHLDFSGQDDLMQEVSGYIRPHP